MLDLFRGVSLIAATLTVGLSAGLLYAFAHTIMPGLGRSDDRTYVGGFQAIDRAIINPWFLFPYVGALVFTVLAALTHLSRDTRAALPWIVAAFLLYLAVVVITGAVNVPLNNELQAAGAPDSITDLAAVRARFEAKWVRWNVARTVASLGAFGCLAWALVLSGRAGA